MCRSVVFRSFGRRQDDWWSRSSPDITDSLFLAHNNISKMKTTTVLAAAAVVATAAPRVVVDAFAVPAYTPPETIRVMDSPGTSSHISSSTSTSSSSLLSSTALVDKELLKSLEAETKAAEKEARGRPDQGPTGKRNNEKYFEYEAKMGGRDRGQVCVLYMMTAVTCAGSFAWSSIALILFCICPHILFVQIEDAEKRAEDEEQFDKAIIEKLKAEIKKDEEEEARIALQGRAGGQGEGGEAAAGPRRRRSSGRSGRPRRPRRSFWPRRSRPRRCCRPRSTPSARGGGQVRGHREGI